MPPIRCTCRRRPPSPRIITRSRNSRAICARFWPACVRSLRANIRKRSASGAGFPPVRATPSRRSCAYTGLSQHYVELSNLRVTNDRFEKELFRDRNQTVGRLDGRFLGYDLDRVADSPDYDPTDPAIGGPVTAALNRYVRDDLKYRRPTNTARRTTPRSTRSGTSAAPRRGANPRTFRRPTSSATCARR